MSDEIQNAVQYIIKYSYSFSTENVLVRSTGKGIVQYISRINVYISHCTTRYEYKIKMLVRRFDGTDVCRYTGLPTKNEPSGATFLNIHNSMLDRK